MNIEIFQPKSLLSDALLSAEEKMRIQMNLNCILAVSIFD